MINEQCCVLVGDVKGDLWWGEKFGPQNEGTPISVEFDADFVLRQEELHNNIVGFYHTHPSFSAHYSARDQRTMKAWSLALGKPLVCCISGTDGLRAWWFLNDEDQPVEYQAKEFGEIIFGITPE